MEGDREQTEQAARADPPADVEERSRKQASLIDNADASRALDDVEPFRLARRGCHVHRLSQSGSDEFDAKRALARRGVRDDDRCDADGRYERLRATQISSAGHLCAHSVVA